jgi:hypothetical protein
MCVTFIPVACYIWMMQLLSKMQYYYWKLETLPFIKNQGLPTVFFSLLVVYVNIFRNPIFHFICLGKQHLVWLEKLCPRVHPCECIHEDAPFPSLNFSADGALIVDAWLYFPGLKCENNLSIFCFFGGVESKSLRRKEYNYSWTRRFTGTFFSCRICFLRKGSWNNSHVERLQIRSTTLSVCVNNKFRNILTLNIQSKCN